MAVSFQTLQLDELDVQLLQLPFVVLASETAGVTGNFCPALEVPVFATFGGPTPVRRGATSPGAAIT